MGIPAAPKGTKAAGKRLWRSILHAYELEEHEMALLKEMARTVDRLDELHELTETEGVMLGERLHPAMVEARQLRIALARLSAALRLPAGEEGDHQQGARRPQRRAGARGVYRLRGVS